ncbi:PAS domain-containing sensor histidine kinase, partial [Halorubrum sp. SS5]
MDSDSDPPAARVDGDESGERAVPMDTEGETPPTAEGDDATVLLLMDADRDRDLLAEALGDRYRVRAESDPAALDSQFDCCLLDAGAFEAVGDALDARRERADPAFLPFALLVGEDARTQPTERTWERVDDVIELPVGRRALLTRVSNLIERRLTSLRLRRTVADLRLKERAMDEAPVGITLARAEGDDNPLLYINEGFETLTGYGEERLG